jgi:hypothetical protein
LITNQLQAAATRTAEDIIRVQAGIRRAPLPKTKPPNRKMAHTINNPINQNRCDAAK